MPRRTLTARDRNTIAKAVQRYVDKKGEFETISKNMQDLLQDDAVLGDLVHSVKRRAKAPRDLRDKLRRKAMEALSRGRRPSITSSNLFTKVPDLAGVRVLHLHTRQVDEILAHTLRLIKSRSWKIVERPRAYTWDEETKQYFEGIKVPTTFKPDLYTSVHLVAEINTQEHWRCEVQLRTLAEEIWGEVSHIINYPHPTKSVACNEELRALARGTSGTSRLVDAIFASYEEYQKLTRDKKARRKRKPHR